MNILIIRNDKLGDFVLSLPCYTMLKATYPDAKVTVLVPEYTADIAYACPYIDEVIIDPGSSNLHGILSLSKKLRDFQFDAVITLFSTTRIGITVLLAGIKYRLAPATKIAQVFYDHRLKQHRSRSEKPEYAYNLELIKKYLLDVGIRNIPDPQSPFLSFDNILVNQLRQQFCQIFSIDENKKLIFIHAGSGGSANNLSLEQYAKLAGMINPDNKHVLVLTAGPGEENKVTDLSQLMHNIPHIVYHSRQGLTNFAQHIAFADLFISGSTGPLHIAGALNVPTAAFYTRRRSATPLRWQTLNTPDRRLAFTPPETAEEMDMSKIDIEAAAKKISAKFLQD
jgi:ADP-heptose:LPS heptosyltransferase